ncbi:MAG: thiamine pyrophosphate-dependent dehydrogenase E1 component subunit alpha [Caldilineaceae bacterium]|nr:thiamine pyrophosphate-dependent dehydrogenase E1 component subunit alpha [Caldilineaceae bacterium]
MTNISAAAVDNAIPAGPHSEDNPSSEILSTTTGLLSSQVEISFAVPPLPQETLAEMYHQALRIRRMEEFLLEAAEQGKIGGAMHTAIGHEANAVGASAALRADDYLTCTYRGHHHGLARGMDVGRAIAEVLGRADGFAGGKGGSMHFVSPAHGMMGSNGIVGAQVPHAAGLALASQLRDEGRIAITFFGDGALFQGVMHETFNIASKWKLPLIFYCENNRYSEMTPTWRTSSVGEFYLFARAYGMESVQIDGNDAEVVHAAVTQAAERARAGDGPTFIEGITYRLAGHMAGDLETYRSAAEIEEQRSHDPVLVLRNRLLERGSSEEAIAAIAAAVEKEVAAAIAFAEASPWPDPVEAYTDVYRI